MHLNNYQQLHALPTVWRPEDKNGNYVFRPLEYGVGTGNEGIDRASPYAEENISSVLDAYKEFFRYLHFAFQVYDLQGLLGLVRHPGMGHPGRLEITLGHSNSNLTPTQAKFIPGKTREAVLYFDEYSRKHGCRCLCPDYGNHYDGHSAHSETENR
ncbi:hypothetical protein KCU77_g451, partial [Aureobasidium melanogenum]